MIWIAIFLLAIVGEVISGAFIAIWFAGGAICAYIGMSAGLSLPMQILSFFLGTAVSMMLLKPLRDRHLKKGLIRTNIDSFLGEVAIVTESIVNVEGKGAVKYKGLVYSTRSINDEYIEKGEQVVIERIEGVKLIVSKKKEEIQEQALPTYKEEEEK